MPPFFLLIVLACAGTAPLLPQPALAQATIDQRALEPLQKPAATPAPPSPQPAKHPPPSRAAPASATGATATHPVSPASPAPPQVRVPLAPPPAPVLPPALVVPTRPPAPPAPAPVAADAPGTATAIQDGLRVTFGEGRADLNPGTESALRSLAHHATLGDTSFTVAAFAPGVPEDPSTPRRLSLSRALTVRAVLIAAGIPSIRVYVKALGASRGVEDGPADRVDVTLAATNPQARSPQ